VEAATTRSGSVMKKRRRGGRRETHKLREADGVVERNFLPNQI
jgi:hypothetical protein